MTNIQNDGQSGNEKDVLLTTEDVADRIQLSVERVRELVNDHTIPCIKLTSRTWRFHWPTVVAALQRR